MSLKRYSSESDRQESQHNNHSAAAQCIVLEHDYPFAELDMLAQKPIDVYASGQHIVLMCSPYDDDVEDEA